MPSFQINDEEREALRGLPMLAREIYVFALRPFMDFATGIVGERRGISWKSIAEELYVEPHQGIKGGEPSEKELCSGQPIPDSGLSFSSATAGGNPSLN
ncbi:hypothetical protein ACQYZC_23675, partial [Pseudomonas aeruginosa]